MIRALMDVAQFLAYVDDETHKAMEAASAGDVSLLAAVFAAMEKASWSVTLYADSSAVVKVLQTLDVRPSAARTCGPGIKTSRSVIKLWPFLERRTLGARSSACSTCERSKDMDIGDTFRDATHDLARYVYDPIWTDGIDDPRLRTGLAVCVALRFVYPDSFVMGIAAGVEAALAGDDQTLDRLIMQGWGRTARAKTTRLRGLRYVHQDD